MLTKLVEYAVFRVRSPAVIQYLTELASARVKKATAKKCRVDVNGVLTIDTSKNKSIHFDSQSLMAQLEKSSPEVTVPVLLDLLDLYDSSGLVVSKTMWKRVFWAKSPVVMFFRKGSSELWADCAADVRILPSFKKSLSVVKLKSGSVRYKLQPSSRFQKVLVDALRRMLEDGKEG